MRLLSSFADHTSNLCVEIALGAVDSETLPLGLGVDVEPDLLEPGLGVLGQTLSVPFWPFDISPIGA